LTQFLDRSTSVSCRDITQRGNTPICRRALWLDLRPRQQVFRGQLAVLAGSCPVLSRQRTATRWWLWVVDLQELLWPLTTRASCRSGQLQSSRWVLCRAWCTHQTRRQHVHI